MEPFALKNALDNVRASVPLVHCITNYVTANDCANALLAIGASPIMSDEPTDVVDITSICGGLVLNIGTLSERTIEGMYAAGKRAGELGHPIVLDPVGAGASKLRTATAEGLLGKLDVRIVRGNKSEVRSLVGAAASTRGVDVNPDDAVTEQNLAENAAFARELAARWDTVVAITGAIDVVADSKRAFAVRNGVPLMGKITGAGCMLTCLSGAFAVANPGRLLEATVASVAALGLAGQIAADRMGGMDGTGSFRTYVLDALTRMDGAALDAGAKVEEIG
ncbi:hydroxyethylthiazole kinase [Gordonibacter sp.]|uniref:hydroxyethylthiazole kinase n=1 Tax=Gordonibacter sp. TaxID=1968902 RepID=UPI002FC9C2EA